MYRYVARRLAEGVVTLLALSLLVFGSVHLTGSPEYFLIRGSEDVTPEIYAMVRKQLGLDKPFIVQYYIFLKRVVTKLDFGQSTYHQRSVRTMMMERIPNTLQLAGAGLLLGILLGVPLGILSAVKRDSIFDKAGKLFAVAGMAAPQFWLAIMLILLFGATLKWLPTYGKGDLSNLVLPALSLGLSLAAAYMRLARSSMLEVLDSEYVRFARIKGLRERQVIWKHAARNAVNPLLTFGGLSLAGLLNGSIVVEVIFAWPGVGRLMLEGVVQRNFPLVEGTILVSAFFFIVTSFIVDVLYGYADPRIRVG
ncbi:MAG: ABC transporter permease [Dehalococcoidia bacterium]|nr:ABC transporter permease [Dehalococcoidia bacterium]